MHNVAQAVYHLTVMLSASMTSFLQVSLTYMVEAQGSTGDRAGKHLEMSQGRTSCISMLLLVDACLPYSDKGLTKEDGSPDVLAQFITIIMGFFTFLPTSFFLHLTTTTSCLACHGYRE